ncbi:hypothetical protein BC826DRAFT_266445 [Russula brevipes]|nr:hypothetical protein BC826DRAFT_266445 [Russula brevipes]
MSSSDPPQIRLSLPQSASNFKRSFDQFGFDLDSPLDSTALASSSGTDEHRPGPSNTDRNKRARSNSVTPNSAEQANPMDGAPSSSSSHHTISSGSSNHAVVTRRDAPPAMAATRLPQTPENDPVFPSGASGEPSHTSPALFDPRAQETFPVEPLTTSAWPNPSSSTNPTTTEQNDQFRLSMERFHAFDSQISTIRTRPSPLPFRAPPASLPPLTHSSPMEHPHLHISPPVSIPSTESLSYTSTSVQPPALVPSTAPPSTTSPGQYHTDMSPLRFEEFGEYREMVGWFQEQSPNSASMDLTIRRRHQSPPISERSRISPPFRRSIPRHMAESVSRNSALNSWPSEHTGAVPDDSDDEFGRPVAADMQGRASLDLPRPHLDSSLLAHRIRRSVENQGAHLAHGRMSPPPFPAMVSTQVEPNSMHPMNGSHTQEPGRLNRHEHWPLHPTSRLPVFAEAIRTLAERLGRARERASHASERRTERSRSPGAGAFSSLYFFNGH